jgi:hypothetical protein
MSLFRDAATTFIDVITPVDETEVIVGGSTASATLPFVRRAITKPAVTKALAKRFMISPTRHMHLIWLTTIPNVGQMRKCLSV